MAQKAIREYYGKRLIYKYLPEYITGFNESYLGVEIDATNLNRTIKLPKFRNSYVAKPDELFGKRGKNNLIFIDKDSKKVLDWIKSKSSNKITIKQNEKELTGNLKQFVIEPFIPHENEYYLAIKTERLIDKLFFSTSGGIEVEENWEKVTGIEIPFSLDNLPIHSQISDSITKLIKNDLESKKVIDFVSAIYQIFKLLDFSYLEINPFVINEEEVHLLDLVARLDNTSVYKNRELFNEVGEPVFPAPFGSKLTESEMMIDEMDEKSGASLKYKLINPEGKIWLLTSGGGGSVIFADTVGDLGYHTEIANYTDYSGNPNTDETQEFCEIIFSDMFKSKRGDKVLIVGGGIANFTDIAKTFTGVARAIEKHHKQFNKQKIKVFVRRGGPNYKRGLELMQSMAEKYKIEMSVHGPEMYMTEVVKIALES
jgi:ATP-citrate lyase beta-subunit